MAPEGRKKQGGGSRKRRAIKKLEGGSRKVRATEQDDTAGEEHAAEHPEHAAPASLAASCSMALTTAPLNVSELQNLPQLMLVQLLEQVVAERDEAKAQVRARDAQLSEMQEYRYLIEPRCAFSDVKRLRWNSQVAPVLAKWEPRACEDGPIAHFTLLRLNGNFLAYHTLVKKFCFQQRFPDTATKVRLHKVMSSALLQYRVCCLFDGIFIDTCHSGDGKVVCQAEVKHVATGEALGFTDFNGAAMLRVSAEKASTEFEADLLELLNTLFDAGCPHPCGNVAGTC